MAWGTARNAGIDDIVDRLRRNDPGLTSLYLMRTRRFDESDARALGEVLAANKTLAELHLSSHPVTITQALALAAGLSSNGGVRHVSIGNSTLGDEALVVLCDGFRRSRSLHTLDLEKKGLTSVSCGPLGRAVLESSTIRRVMLSDNELGDQGVADFLVCSSKLEALELCACLNKADQWTLVAQAMAEAFSEAHALRRLELDRNALDERGAAALSGGLSTLTALEQLSLNGNPAMGPGGLRALVFPSSLRRLDVGSTGAGDDGLRALANLVGAGKLPKLEYINVCGCGATCRGLAALLDGFGKNGGNVFEVDAGGNVLCDENLERFEDSLLSSVLRCRRLQSLRLHGCSLGAAGAQAFVRALTSETSDKRVHVDEICDKTGDGTENHSYARHALRDVDISGNCIPEADMLDVLGALPSAVAPDGPLPCLKTFIIAANPEVEGPAVAGRVEALVGVGVVVMRAANDGDCDRRASAVPS